MSEKKFDGAIVAGTCFVCGGDLICDTDGVGLTCAKCGLSLKVQRTASQTHGSEETPQSPVTDETTSAKVETPAAEQPAEPEEVDSEIVALATSLAENPSAPIPAPRMNALSLANDATKRAILPQILLLANTAMQARKFRRAVPLFSIANSVAPSADLYISIMLAKAGCGDVTEIPASDIELTTMAEYTGFLKIADDQTRTEFLTYVRLQAERKEEAEEARMEEERLAYIAVQSKRLKVLTPFAFTSIVLAVLFFLGILSLGILGQAFAVARIFFALSVAFALLSIALFIATTLLVRNINRAEDMETDHRAVAILSVFCLTLIIFSSLVLFFAGISGYDGRADGYYYRYTEDGIAISAPKTTATTLTIPETLHGNMVTALVDFSESTTLVGVTVPNTVTTIEEFAFASCTSLTEVNLPDGLTYLGNGVFKGCTALVEITVPAGVETLSGHMFSGCTALKDVSFPADSKLNTIATNAFSACTALPTIEIPAGVSTIADNAFYGCTALVGFTGGERITTIGSKAFYGCTSLFELVFADGLVSIGGQAFENCTALMAVTTPVSIESIGAYAFRNCINLIDVIIPTGSATLGTGVFNGCEKLGQIYTPETPADQFSYVEEHGEITITKYNGTDAIVSVPAKIDDMPVVAIGEEAFAENRDLTNVTLPNGLLFIRESAFEGCTALVSVRFGTDLVEIGKYAFRNCNALSKLSLEHCTSLLAIEEQAFLNCWELAEINFAPNLHTIQQYAFESCRKLVEVKLPNSLAVLQGGAFRGCTGLRSFTFGTGALQVYPLVFFDCNALKSIEVRQNVTLVTREVNNVLLSPFSGWKIDQMIVIRYPRPDDFPGFGPDCAATERWGS